jgi:hypothetical protein
MFGHQGGKGSCITSLGSPHQLCFIRLRHAITPSHDLDRFLRKKFHLFIIQAGLSSLRLFQSNYRFHETFLAEDGQIT